jgi:dual specificity protein kinase YAK1
MWPYVQFLFSLDLYRLFWALLRFLWFLWVQLPVRVTKDIVETYQLCNPSFQHSENLNPKRYLTNPSIPKFNGGCDNENHDLILYYGCVFVNENATRR